jgi:hypothetical protein
VDTNEVGIFITLYTVKQVYVFLKNAQTGTSVKMNQELEKKYKTLD